MNLPKIKCLEDDTFQLVEQNLAKNNEFSKNKFSKPNKIILMPNHIKSKI